MDIVFATQELITKLAGRFPENQAAWFRHCCLKTAKGNGYTLIAVVNNLPIGFISVLYKASYHYFHKDNIPEIHGMAVLEKYRRQGAGRHLLLACEKEIKAKGYNVLGLGVGVTEDYQPAFKLYVIEGYIPDGKGLYHHDLPHHFIRYGDIVTIDSSTSLWLIKRL